MLSALLSLHLPNGPGSSLENRERHTLSARKIHVTTLFSLFIYSSYYEIVHEVHHKKNMKTEYQYTNYNSKLQNYNY